jgi:hypothetical protein
MRAEIDDAGRLSISPDEPTQLQTIAVSTFCLVLSAGLAIGLLALRGYLALAILSPFIGGFLLIAVYPLVVVESVQIDRREGKVICRRRYFRRRSMREHSFDDFQSVRIREGTHRRTGVGPIPDFELYLVLKAENAGAREIELGGTARREEADEIAEKIRRYSDWPIEYVLEQT